MANEHSKKFETVKTYWLRRVWNEAKMRQAVVKGWITAEEFTEITGLSYE